MAGGRVARRSVIDWSARVLLGVVIVGANVLGTIVLTALALWAMPTGPVPDIPRVRAVNLALVPLYVAVTVPLGLLWVGLRFRVRPGDTAAERRLVLYGPLKITLVQGVFWFGGAVAFGLLNSRYSVRLGLAVAEVAVVGGISTCALCYLLAERILRRTAVRVLAGDPPRRRFKAGVLVRFVLFWTLGTAVPVSGLLLSGAGALVYGDVPSDQLAILVLASGGAALVTGLLTTVGAARAMGDPVRGVRRALRTVEEGDLSVSVPVYDGTELGELQAGFNTMVAGLRERDRIRDLFGRQVGQDVASAATRADEVRLGGEVRTVAVLFVDLAGSTEMAADRPPTEVVELLNQFFGVVVGAVESCGGWINKFEGDAALAVFGAPTLAPDPAGQALRAARTLAGRLHAELPEVFAGIGVSAGCAVAGYVGGVHRYEYTVIGDPVNEAARLTELAKTVPGRVLASDAALRMADPAESRRWRLGDAMTLRGRTAPTRLATPADTGGRPPLGRDAEPYPENEPERMAPGTGEPPADRPNATTP